METKILVIDDEAAICRLLRLNLESRGYTVETAASGQAGLRQAAEFHPHLILLDLGLPDMTGLEVLRALRDWASIPILVLTVEDAEYSKVSLLDAGADDYITKPFGIPELMARLKVALRHQNADGATPVFTSHELEIDLAKRTVFKSGSQVKLTATEYEFLKILVLNAGKVVSQETLLKKIWGKNNLDNPHYLRIYAGQLRKKLELNPSSPKHIMTEPGIGYRLL